MNINSRIIYGLVVCLSIVLGPWWVSGVLILVGIVFIPRYIEGIIFAFIMDIIFQNPGANLSWWFTISTLALLLVFEGVIKNKVRFYKDAF